MVQARVSSGPVVRNEMRPRRVVGEVDHAVEAGFAGLQGLAELGFVLGRHLGELYLELAAESSGADALAGELRGHLRLDAGSSGHVVLADVEYDDQGLGAEELEIVEDGLRLGGQQLLADGRFVFQS